MLHNSVIKIIPPRAIHRAYGGKFVRGGYDVYVFLALSLTRRCISLEITSRAACCDCESRRASHRAGVPRDRIARDVRGIPRPLVDAGRRIRSENPIFLEPFRGPCLDKGCHLCFPLPFFPLPAERLSLSSNFRVNSSPISRQTAVPGRLPNKNHEIIFARL